MLTVERLRELLDCDPEAGVFTWRVSRQGGRQGANAGTRRPSGYVCIGIDGHPYRRHRLVWLFVYGKWPPADLDHKNGVREDDRIKNLRPATRSQNLANMRYTGKEGGLKGVSRNGKKWKSQLSVNNQTVHLGTFATPEKAHVAYQRAALELRGEFARFA